MSCKICALKKLYQAVGVWIE